MASLDKRFARDERISWRVIENEAVLVDPDEGELLRFNPIGTEIWQDLDGTRTVDDIIDHIHQIFEVNRKRAQRDVLRFLNKLVRRELVGERSGNGREPS